jgi:hypothetical protein
MLPNLEEISCQNNVCLTEIPRYDKLRFLNCSDCGVIKLPELDNLVMIHCNGNTQLRIPYLKNIKYIGCEGSTYLQNAGITSNIRYHVYKKLVDVLVVLIIHSRSKPSISLSMDLIRIIPNYIY